MGIMIHILSHNKNTYSYKINNTYVLNNNTFIGDNNELLSYNKYICPLNIRYIYPDI